MESIQVLGKLKITQVVTDYYKQQSGAKFQVEIDKVEQELAAYEKEMNKTITELTLKAHPQVEQVRRQLNQEKEKLVVYLNQLKMSKEAIIQLPEGEIVETGEGNFLKEIRVGDHFENNANCEIVLKDGIVIAINQ